MIKTFLRKVNTIRMWGWQYFRIRQKQQQQLLYVNSNQLLLLNNRYTINIQRLSFSKISLIIPTISLENIERLVGSIEKLSLPNTEIIVLDNSKTGLNYSNHKLKVYHFPIAFNYSSLNNYAASKANGDILWFLNDDMSFENFTLEDFQNMLSIATNKKVGAVGNMLQYPDGTLQHGGIDQTYWLGGEHIYKRQDPYNQSSYAYAWVKYPRIVDAVTGASLMIESNKFRLLKGFDENLPVDFNDIDLCIRLRKLGYINVVHNSFITHYESASRGKDMSWDKTKRFIKNAKYLLRNYN